MRLALKEANKALKKDEVPIGAVIIDKEGNVISKTYNKVESRKSQTEHAEILAIRKAGKALGDWRLNDCSLYVTLEPCSMCMSAIMLSRIGKIVYGADSPLFGYKLDSNKNFEVYNCPVNVRSGVCAEEAGQLLRLFFKRKRKS